MNEMNLNQLQIRLSKWLTRKTSNSAIRRIGDLPITIGSDIGSVRSENQDRVAVLKMQDGPNQSFSIAVLCDGMGGMVEGTTCAAQAIASFLASFCFFCGIAPAERMVRAAHEANRTVYSLYHGKGGATLSAVLFDSKGDMIGVNVGDSRIYSYQQNVLGQLTVDDTMAGLLPQAEDNIRLRNELLQFVGIGEGLDPHVVNIPASQELILLTSDGVHFLDKNILQMVIRSANEPAIAARRVIESANAAAIAARRIIEIAKWCGGRDNASIAIATPMESQLKKVEDSEVIQVWDPFGELQVIISGSICNGLIKKDSLLGTPPVVNGRKSPKKREKAKPNKRKKSVDDIPQEKNKKTEIEQPQLKIFFDKSSTEERHA